MTGVTAFQATQIAIYVLLMLAPGAGLAVVCLRRTKVRLPGLLAVSVASGLTLCAVAGLLAALLPGAPVLPVTWGLAILGLVAVAIVRRRGALPVLRDTGPREAWRRPGLPVGLAVLLAVGLLVAVHALHVPLWEWDAWSNWDLKARLLVHHLPTGDWQERLQDPTLGFTHPTYPMGLHLQRAIIYLIAATPYTSVGKVVEILWFAVLTLALWSLARQRLKAGPAMLLTAATLATPAMIGWATSGFAEIPVAALYAVALYCLREFHRAPTRWGPLLGVALAGLMFMKNEGLVLAAVVGFVALLLTWRGRRPGRWRGLIGVVVVAAVLIAPWLLVRAGFPSTNENYPSHLRVAVISENLQRLPEILRTLGGAMVDIQTWGLLWLALPVAALLGARAWRRHETRIVWLMLALHLAVYCLIWVITPWDVTVLLHMTVDRLLVQISPLVVIILAIHLAAAMRPAATHHEAATVASAESLAPDA